MISGMTGYGSCEVGSKLFKAVVEIKTVNHRYLDLSFYLPTGFAEIEDKIRKLVQKSIVRGRVTISFKFIEKPQQTMVLNKITAQKYLSFSRQLQKDLKIKDALTLSDLIVLPGVVQAKETYLSVKAVEPFIIKGVAQSLRNVTLMRRKEGKSLVKDVGGQLRQMRVSVGKIKIRIKGILKNKKTTLLAEEFEAYQRGVDVNEEIKRLTHYIDQVKESISSTVSLGKNIDFIAQEMQRETNTIGSKVQDMDVSTAVISLKGKIEKIREQAQNIE